MLSNETTDMFFRTMTCDQESIDRWTAFFNANTPDDANTLNEAITAVANALRWRADYMLTMLRDLGGHDNQRTLSKYFASIQWVELATAFFDFMGFSLEDGNGKDRTEADASTRSSNEAALRVS